MDEGSKKRAYLEGMRLKKAGHDNEVIYARLEKQGIPDELITEVLKNLAVQQKIDVIKEQTPFYNIALTRIGIGVFFAIISYFLIPGKVYIPIGLIFSGIVAAYLAKTRMK